MISSSYNGSSYSVRNLVNGFNSEDISDFSASYINDGVIFNYINTVKFGFASMYYATSGNNGTNYRYGTKITNLPDFEQGTLDGNGNKIYYTYGFNNLSDKDKYSGIWGADINYPTPLQYPTTSDEVMAVRASNEALVYNLRSFGLPGGNTPLGGMVHMMYYLFNNTEKSTEGVVDPGLKLQPMPNGKYIEPVRDNAWACRAKAVVAMTDGSPVSGLQFLEGIDGETSGGNRNLASMLNFNRQIV
ncbi:MAG: hypothetical protein IIY06_05980, partial [Proteobacteria bacterium]|nr:hypothetical protein [Pseudomonadota bacterium]